MSTKFDPRLHAAHVINDAHHQQNQRGQGKFFPPAEIKRPGHFRPRKQNRHQTRDLHAQDHCYAAATRSRAFVRTPGVRQIHDAKPDGHAAHNRREQVSHGQTNQKNEDILV